MDLARSWEAHASEWIRWAREPGHDGFWDGTWPALRQLLAPPGGLVLDVGCGEGRLGRELVRLGYHVVGVERSKTLAHAANSCDQPFPVVAADATHIPMRNAGIAMALACMCLQDMDNLNEAVAEIARVLRPGGSLLVALVHPLANCVGDPSTMKAESIVVSEPYLAQRRMETRVERDGIGMTFVSTHRPLSAYVAALIRAGFVISDLREDGEGALPWLLTLRADSLRGAGSFRT